MKVSQQHIQIGATLIGVIALNALVTGSFAGDKAFYASLEQPDFAPPGWLINNTLNIAADFRVREVVTTDDSSKKPFAISQAIFWASFFSFGFVYFREQSPTLGFLMTAVGFAATAVSTNEARKVDLRSAKLLVPTLMWLAFATLVSGSIAWENRQIDRVIPF